MKWIVSDLDGTLLNDDRTVGERTVQGIQNLVKKGFPFVIATGRGFASANTIRKKLGVPIYMVCNNGATIYSDRKSTRLNSSHANISYAVFCLKKKKK